MTDLAAMDIETIPHAARDILGVRVHDMTRDRALAHVLGMIDSRLHCPVTFLNAHNANIAFTDPDFRATLSRFLVLSDGIGVDIAAWLLHGAPFRANLNGSDFVPALLAAADHPLKVGLFGARPGVAEKAIEAFARIDARHQYRALAHGYVDADDERAMLDELARWRADILLVALGVPRQEMWIAANVRAHHCTVPMGVGALFDLTTGTVPRAPRWVRAARSEWVYRLAQEPGRMWRRYLLGNPVFLSRVVRQRLGATLPGESTA
ncbi:MULTISPECIES: WecB/TagA/CpsF family glycosyltransferase [unclassified Roseitalea]|uniref:WecB/TagA/CpsF family glycosyltransferase n=1 Tax=unclassified Roseitalea TaxID=2639107 RepID=UPI00273D9818|nr:MULTISPECIES: WecB/TagA/CpsF family glycosyltransferase [unclassified Roseitalea]